jgi:hypothetical protein
MMLTYERMQKERARLLDAGLRTWGNGDLDRDTALHEGAHVLVAHLLHLNPTRATIEPGLGYAGMTSLGRASARAEAVAVCLAAGDEAEALFGGPGAGRNDSAQMRTVLGAYYQSSAIENKIAAARRTARMLLRDNLGALVTLAVELVNKRTLSAAEIKEIMSAFDEGDDGDVVSRGSVRMLDRGLIQYRVSAIL